jgi:hypothetical protein
MKLPRNVVIISDTHVGSRVALCPKSFRLKDGGAYAPSNLQLNLYGWWEEFWGSFVPKATKGEPYVVVHNGDCVDGAPHGSVAEISHLMDDQVQAAVELLEPVVHGKRVIDYYHVLGTEAHVAKSGELEENVARELGAKKDKEGRSGRWELWLRIGDGKRTHLLHFLHHISTTSSSAHEASAVNAELTAELTEAARWGETAPNAIIRSHRHRAIEVRLPSDLGWRSAIVTPAWQAKTPFCYKIAGARLAPPQIGGIVLRVSDGYLFSIPFVKHFKREEPE